MLVVPCSPSNSPQNRNHRWIRKAPELHVCVFCFFVAKCGMLLGCLGSFVFVQTRGHRKQTNSGPSCLSFLDHVVNLLPLLVVSHLSFFRLLSVVLSLKTQARSTHHPTTTTVKKPNSKLRLLLTSYWLQHYPRWCFSSCQHLFSCLCPSSWVFVSTQMCQNVIAPGEMGFWFKFCALFSMATVRGSIHCFYQLFCPELPCDSWLFRLAGEINSINQVPTWQTTSPIGRAHHLSYLT